MIKLGKCISAAICLSGVLMIIGTSTNHFAITVIGVTLLAAALISGYINMKAVSRMLNKETIDEAIQMGILDAKK